MRTIIQRAIPLPPSTWLTGSIPAKTAMLQTQTTIHSGPGMTYHQEDPDTIPPVIWYRIVLGSKGRRKANVHLSRHDVMAGDPEWQTEFSTIITVNAPMRPLSAKSPTRRYLASPGLSSVSAQAPNGGPVGSSMRRPSSRLQRHS